MKTKEEILNYELIDIGYNYPYCNLSNTERNISIYNNYGNMTIETDNLINYLKFRFYFRATRQEAIKSCQFCDYNKNYCNSIISINNIKLLNEFKIIFIQYDDEEYYSFNFNNNNFIIKENEIIFNINNNNITSSLFKNINCSRNFKLIILPTIKIIYPFGKNINLISYDNDKKYILCNSSLSIFNNINCSLIKKFYYITYYNNNCIKPIIFNNNNQLSYFDIQSNTTLQSKEEQINYLPIYWYYQFLNNNIDPIYQNLILCGKKWKYLFLYSNLTLICNNSYLNYVDINPFYKLIIQYITTSLNLVNSSYSNNNYIKENLLLSYNIIENNCNNNYLNLTYIPLFNNILEILTNFNYNNNYEYEKEKYCNLIHNNINYIKDNSNWIPNYINYRNEWFFILYKYFILHDENMYLYSIVLSSLLLLFLIIGIVLYLSIIIIYIYKKTKDKPYIYIV